jgi:biopolymer transport protein ExbB/TolQ
MNGAFFAYLHNATWPTYLVAFTLSAYFISVMWVYLYRYFYLSEKLAIEKESVEYLLSDMGSKAKGSYLEKCNAFGKLNERSLKACMLAATKDVTYGLSLLSIVASTSPFVGLFGTVVSILDSFAKMGMEGAANVQSIAPSISEALVSTAFGILVAIPAFAFHIVLKRKGFEIINYINMQSEIILSKSSR